MNRPIGVTASAVVAMLGSVLALLLAGLMVASLFVESMPKDADYRGNAIGSAVLFGAFAGVGLATALGLFRLRRWARTATLVFAGLMAALSLVSLIVMSIIPLPTQLDVDPAVARTIRPAMMVVFAIPLVIGAWWLVQFNTASAKLAFAAGAPGTDSQRPVSITIIAWAMLIGGVSCVLPVSAGTPAFLAGLELVGWPARLVYALFGVLSLYIGWGLLKLSERARLVAIAWFSVSLAHMALVTLVPGLRARMLELQQSFMRQQAETPPFDPTAFTSVMLVFVALLAVLAIWFLVRDRAAFERSYMTDQGL